MENTKIQSFSTEEAISPKRSTDCGGRAPFFLSTELQACKPFFLSTKRQARASDERQAASLQASSQRSCQATSAECGPNHP